MNGLKVVYDDERIENVNYAMLIILESKHKILGTEYIIEDGMITGVVIKDKIIQKRLQQEV